MSKIDDCYNALSRSMKATIANSAPEEWVDALQKKGNRSQLMKLYSTAMKYNVEAVAEKAFAVLSTMRLTKKQNERLAGHQGGPVAPERRERRKKHVHVSEMVLETNTPGNDGALINTLGGTIQRIARGVKFPHENDGGVYANKERVLPMQPRGYYTEYVHAAEGSRGPGRERVILGKNGDLWYTPDHYRTFS